MAEQNSKPVKNAPPPVLVRHERKRDMREFWRTIPAALASLIFHVALIGMLMLILGPATAEEQFTEEAVVETAPEEKPLQDPLITTDIDPNAKNPEQDINYNAERVADVSVSGTVDTNQAVGVIDAKEAPPITLPPPQGFGQAGQGGLVESMLAKNTAFQPGEVGGFLDQAKLAGTFFGRSGATRQQAVIEGGGTKESEACVVKGLRWIISVQQANGSWQLDDTRFKDPGRSNDTAATAFGLLPLLGSGYTHKKAPPNAPFNPYDKPIEKALIWLINRQNKRDGDLGGGMYAHSLATIALCEAYGLSQDPLLRKPAQMAVNYLIRAQHDAGGWRYGPRQAGDLSVSGWSIMALKSGQMSGLDVPEMNMRKAINYVNAMCNETNEGYGYTGPGSSDTMSAVGLLCRQYLQAWGPQNIRMIKGVNNHLKTRPPAPNYKNIYYYYYATQVMHHFGGNAWKEWNDKMRELLVKAQSNDGSWSSEGDRHGGAGGRLMITSLNLLTLEVYYRHLPLYYRESGVAAAGN